jgi:hypothetical protein
MGAALRLGVRPGPRTLRALLAACDDLDARASLGPFAFAAAPPARVGGVSLREVLAAVRAEMGPAGGGGGAGADGGAWVWGGDAERAAAGVVRTLAFESSFGGGGEEEAAVAAAAE